MLRVVNYIQVIVAIQHCTSTLGSEFDPWLGHQVKHWKMDICCFPAWYL